MGSLLRAWVGAGVMLLVAAPSHGAGVHFPGAGCAFDHWPQTGWRVAPPAEGENGSQLLRASHEPRLGLALEAWVGPIGAAPDEGRSSEELQRAALEKRGWTVSRVDRAPVGDQLALRARAHRRAAGRAFLMEEYAFEAAGRRYTLRVTARGVGALQSPHVQRWLRSFRLL